MWKIPIALPGATILAPALLHAASINFDFMGTITQVPIVTDQSGCVLANNATQ
jgi:hypothetical protein